jgi:hypothetical protein
VTVSFSKSISVLHVSLRENARRAQLAGDRLGYGQLAEPVRFTAAWERVASLRLRRGDATALDDYDHYGRICGGPPEQAMDQAAEAYVASYLAGRDVLLMAADWARCRASGQRDLRSRGPTDCPVTAIMVTRCD